MSQAATIEVRFVNPVKEGKKRGSIKTPDDELYLVKPQDLGRFQAGRTYDIEYDESTFNGRTYRTIRTCKPQRIEEAAGAPDQSPAPKTNSEAAFVAHGLCAAIRAGSISFTERDLIRAGEVLKGAWRRLNL